MLLRLVDCQQVIGNALIAKSRHIAAMDGANLFRRRLWKQFFP